MVREGPLSLNENLRIDHALDAATEQLRRSSDSPRLDAELLLARALDVPRSYLFAHPDDEMDPAAFRRFDTTIRHRADGMPMAYLTGEKEFWSMRLIVSPATLVPRPDTEVLVEQALSRIPRKANWQIADLGTGSGAIAFALARERPLCHVTATDCSAEALEVAAENARQLAVPNVGFCQGNWAEPLNGQVFDLVVSNPPYVASDDPHLEKLRHEPVAALDAGDDGLDAIRTLATTVAGILKSGGGLLLEHGAQQAGSVAEILEKSGWTNIRTMNDIEGRPRVSVATKR